MSSTTGRPRVFIEFNGHQSFYSYYGWLHLLGGQQHPWALVENESGELRQEYLERRGGGHGVSTLTFVDLDHKAKG